MNEMILSRQPERSYFVEVKVANGTGRWIKVAGPMTRPQAEEALNRQWANTGARVGVEVALRYANIPGSSSVFRLIAGWRQRLTMTGDQETGKLIIPLYNEHIGAIDFEIGGDELRKMLGMLDEMKEVKADDIKNAA